MDTPILNSLTVLKVGGAVVENADSLAQCASHLSLQDLSHMAMTCKYFQTVAYSDSVWLRWFRFSFFSSHASFLFVNCDFFSPRFEV